MLVNPLPWLRAAQRGGYAVGAFNANTLEQVQAIVAAAAAENAPAIIQISRRALLYIGVGDTRRGLRMVTGIAQVAAGDVDVPICLHLDHGSAEDVLLALELRFTSVMFDGGELPLAENIARTAQLCRAAHDAGACMEAELGEVPRLNAEGVADAGMLTRPDEAAAFVSHTGIDTLAVAIGSVHAGRQKDTMLDLPRLADIRTAVDVPLVLHGSSGVTDVCLLDGIRLGLCKVNVATQLNQAFTVAVREVLAASTREIDPRRYLGPAREAMAAQVAERIRTFGSAGKATAAIP
jgi:fructose-bisphosphate aldolase, class II